MKRSSRIKSITLLTILALLAWCAVDLLWLHPSKNQEIKELKTSNDSLSISIQTLEKKASRMDSMLVEKENILQSPRNLALKIKELEEKESAAAAKTLSLIHI